MKAKNISLCPRYLREGRPVRIIADGAISTVGTHEGVYFRLFFWIPQTDQILLSSFAYTSPLAPVT